MKKLALALLSIFILVSFSFTQNIQQRWIPYGKDVKGKEYYYDSNIRRSANGTITAWIKINIPNSDSFDLQLVEYDCKKGETKLLRSANSSNGEITSLEINGKWEIPIPSTMNEIALNAICKNSTPVKNIIDNEELGFNFQVHPKIQKSIDFYKGNGRSTMETGLYRSGMFMRMARRIFREEGVPENIAWIGQIVSAWKPDNPLGLWRINNQIGGKYGLRKTTYVNEITSFEKSTRAAASYLKFLAKRYNDNWELAMAAYVSDEKSIDLAVKKAKTANYWVAYPYLPKETRDYVPNTLATILIANNPNQYGFGHVRPAPQLMYDQIRVPASTNLNILAQASDTTVEYLRYLNPELRTNTSPSEPYIIRVPPGKANEVVALFKKMPKANVNLESITKTTAGESLKNIANVDIEDLGIDVAIVSAEKASLLEQFNSTNSILQLKKGTLLALIDRTPKNNFYNVIDIATSIEGWIDRQFVSVKLTSNPNSSPTFEERKVDANVDPTLVITNQTEEILSLRFGGKLYTIPANAEKRIVVSAGTYKFYGSVPNAIPRVGEKYFPKGIIYYWRFFTVTEEK